MEIYNIYFSPTGGTKKAADIVCRALADGRNVTEIDLSVYGENYSRYQFKEGDLCVAAVPSYGGRVPAIVVERLASMSGGGAKAVLMAVYGNREFEDTLVELEDTLAAAGFVCEAAISVVAEHSIVHQYGAGRPDEEDQAELQEFAAEIKRHLTRAGIPIPEESGAAWIPGNRPYKPFGVVSLKPRADNTCVRCGVCAARCPVQAIPTDNPSKTNWEICIACMRCRSICPIQARKLDQTVLDGLTQKLAKVCQGRKENNLYLKNYSSTFPMR